MVIASKGCALNCYTQLSILGQRFLRPLLVFWPARRSVFVQWVDPSGWAMWGYAGQAGLEGVRLP